jgi:RecA/RadA recombinase
MMVSASIAKKGGKVIFIDTEGGFSVERFRQILGEKEDFEIMKRASKKRTK